MGTAIAQDPLKGILTTSFGDVSALKQKAEAGDPRAQVALAGVLEQHLHATEALGWYRKAAAAGDLEGVYQVGRMLLFGQAGIPLTETVQPDPAQGIRWTYMAATNGYHKAFGNMCGAFQRGLGVSTNLIAAYAWLQLYMDVEPNVPLGQYHLNEMALKMDSASIAQARNLAARLKQGQWPGLQVTQIPQSDTRLKLNGISYGGRIRLAVINGKSLEAGEATTLPLRPTPLRVTVLKIEKDRVLIAVEGEDQPRLLHL